MFKRIFIFVMFFLPFSLMAQAPFAVPNIFVDDIVLEKTSFALGENITGTFLLVNGKNEPAQNITYKISLVGLSPSGFVKNVYDIKPSITKPMVLAPLESRRVFFSYTLPKTFSARDLALEIQAQNTNGIKMGWDNARIKVSSGLPLVNITSSAISVDSKNYGVAEGALIYEEKSNKAFLNVGLYADFPSGLPLLGKLTIYEDSLMTSVLYSTTTDIFVSSTSTEKNPVVSKISLPVFDYNSGIYYGIYEFLDKKNEGVRRSSIIPFHYVVVSPASIIHSIVSSKVSLNKGDDIDVGVFYVNNFDPNINTKDGRAFIKIRIYNEKDELVMEQKKDISLFASSVFFNAVSSIQANALRGEAEMYIDGKNVANFKSKISRDYEAERLVAGNFFSRNYFLFYLVSAIVAFIIILLVLFLAMRNRARKSMYLLWFISFSFISFSFYADRLLALIANIAPTFVETSCTGLGCGDVINKNGLNIFINNKEYLKPGEKFYITGFSRFFANMGEPDNLKYEITFGNQKGEWTSVDKEDIKISNFGSRFIIGAKRGDSSTYFVAPEKAGTYRANIKVIHTKGWVGTKDGYIDFVVGTPGVIEETNNVNSEDSLEIEVLENKDSKEKENSTSTTPIDISVSG